MLQVRIMIVIMGALEPVLDLVHEVVMVTVMGIVREPVKDLVVIVVRVDVLEVPLL